MTTPASSWREFPALVTARRKHAEAEAALPGLVEAARQSAANLATARQKDERADLDALTGKGSAKDRDKTAAVLLEKRKASAVADDLLEQCQESIDRLRLQIPALEVEAKATVWTAQRSAYLEKAEAVSTAAERLAALQVEFVAMRNHLDYEFWFVPSDASGSQIKDGLGNLMFDHNNNPIFDGSGPVGRVRFPDGACASMLGLGLEWRDVTAERVERFKARARQHGVKV